MIKDNYLNELLVKVKADVDHVLINNTLSITSFSLESVVGNEYTLKFSVIGEDVETITNIKLLKSDNTVITEEVVNIIVPSSEVIIRQKITISEVTL